MPLFINGKSLQECLLEAEEFLKEAGIENAAREAQLLFCLGLGLDKAKLFTLSTKPLSQKERAKLEKLVKSRASKMPFAYLAKTKNFYGRDFYVSRHVLIPRPETEELCELVLRTQPVSHLADLGCGSGCLGLTLYLENFCQTVLLCDISRKAIEIACKNAARLLGERTSSVTFLHHDFTKPFPYLFHNFFDVVVSNPPYVIEEEWEEVSPDVRFFEPKLALLVKNPKRFFHDMFCQVGAILKIGGRLFLETSPNLISLQKSLLEKLGFCDVEVHQDYAYKNRFLSCRKAFP
ncbi:MAG: peptide chain release factor N(5)-glutamine methyltransferase [Leptospiraceae bacterium]|nr:peptide chain release factor N(5)-glutamine methyltransferase [Leptospiraceae bacterium]MDW8306326.1 peptide chain release factor N(5)-glutamine methyltransferase [Leptospiraceae bacterium]